MAPHSPTRVLILAPMKSELRPLLKKLSLKRPGTSEQAVYEGRAGAVEVVAATIGVGPEVARRTTERLVESFGVDRVVLSGIAGGVDHGLKIGDVILPDRVIDAETGVEYHPSVFGGIELEGTILTTAQLITGKAEITALRDKGVKAVEMEGAAVGEVCSGLDLPWTLFRSISDHADEGVVDDTVLAMLNADGSTNVAAAARLIAANPGRLKGLVRLARDSQKAANAAAEAAISAILQI
jgi:adenosylhomocysteine nucleosidase